MSKDLNKSPSAPALERGLALLERVAGADGPVAFTTLEREMDIPRASLIRLLAVLRRSEHLTRDAAGYTPGPACLRLGGHVDPLVRLKERARPELTALHDLTRCTVICFARVGDDTISLDKVVSPMGIAMQELGRRTSNLEGRSPWSAVAIAELPPRRQEAVLRRLKKEGLKPGPLKRIMAAFRRDGWADDARPLFPGIRRLAVPIRDAQGYQVGFLAIGGPAPAISDAAATRYGKALVAAAARLA